MALGIICQVDDREVSLKLTSSCSWISNIIIVIIIQTFVLNAPINEEHHIGARSARRESVNLKQASFQ